jgi:hypothetical protein
MTEMSVPRIEVTSKIRVINALMKAGFSQKDWNSMKDMNYVFYVSSWKK